MPEPLAQQLLDEIQSSFPLEGSPYLVLAGRFGASEEEVRAAIAGLYENGEVRRIGASFDSRKLGYTSTLCALAVPGGRGQLQQAAEVVSAYPGVTHNYGRAHRYNLWFTLITRSAQDKQGVLDEIRAKTGCNDLLDMPATKKFKISVDFGAQRAAAAGGGDGSADRVRDGEASPGSEGSWVADTPAFDADDPFDIELVRWAQADIVRDANGALLADPYAAGADALNQKLARDDITAEAVLQRIVQLKSNRTVRRFGAMVRHHRIGFAFNSMTVWDVPDEQVEEAGKLFASAPFVSHCYTRLRQPSWDANLYAMTHAQSKEELQANTDSLADMLAQASISCPKHFALETTDEFKKTSMTYFV